MAEQLSFCLEMPGTRATEPMKPPRKARFATTRRACLSCNRLFPSRGAHNRICSDCKGQDMWRGPSEFGTAISF